MAPIFTTTCRYKGGTYTALVSHSGADISISLMDGALQVVLRWLLAHPRECAADEQAGKFGETCNLVAAIVAAVEASGAWPPKAASTLCRRMTAARPTCHHQIQESNARVKVDYRVMAYSPSSFPKCL